MLDTNLITGVENLYNKLCESTCAGIPKSIL